MSIYINAIGSIQIGVEDYQCGESRRDGSAARNIVAGILLLYKEKLCRLSPIEQPELLIKQNIDPILKADRIVFTSQNNNTVNIATIKKRFKDFSVNVNWKSFDKIIQLRNDIEHYYTESSQEIVRELVSSSFVLIRDFLVDELKETPVEVLGQETWQVLLEVNEVYETEKKECDQSIAKIDWKFDTIKENIEYLFCCNCSSSLVEVDEVYETGEYPDINLHCKSCNHEFLFCDVIEDIVENALRYELHINIMDGGDDRVYDMCPSCGLETFVYKEGGCVNCEYQMEYTECEKCGEPLGLDEQGHEGLCHHDYHLYEKMMRD